MLKGWVNKKILVVMLLALVIRVIFSICYLPGHGIELYEYDDIAKNLVGGQGFRMQHLSATYFACTPPLYPFLCALFYKIFGINPVMIVCLQIAISIFACFAIYLVGRSVAGEAVGLISALLYAVHPGFILYTTTKLHSLVLDSLLFTLTLLMFMRLRSSGTVKQSVLTGVTAGMAALTRSTIVSFLPFSFLWLMFCFRKNIKRFFVLACFIVIGFAVVVSPWVARNYLVMKDIVFITSADAEVFWRGNNANATGSSYTNSGEVVLMLDKELYKKVNTLTENEQRRLFREKAMDFIKKDPKGFAMLFAKKLYYFWWFSPSAGILYPSVYMKVYKYIYGAFLALATLGFFTGLRKKVRVDGANLAILIIFLVSISVFQSLFYVEGRHRWGIEPVLFVLTALGMFRIYGYMRTRKETI